MGRARLRGLALALTSAGVAALTGCGGSGEGERPPQPSAAPQGVTVSVDRIPGTLDAARAATIAERAVAAASQTPLLTYRRRTDTDAATLQPGLALELPGLSPDHTEYRFNLRPGLLYADGRVVTASDVERAISHASRVSTDPELRSTLRSIIGAPSADGQTLPGVRTDDRTGAVVVRLRRPDGRIPLALADPATAPLPELPSGTPGALPASTGPLRVARITDTSIELVANPLRARISTVPAARTAQVTLTGESPTASDLKSGAIDVDLDPDTTDGAPTPAGSTSVSAPTGAVWSLVVAPNGVFSDRLVRVALANAIDRRGLASITRLAATCGLLPPYAVGAVVRDDCPPVPVTPKKPPLAGVALRIGVEATDPSQAAGGARAADVRSTASLVGDAIHSLGGTAAPVAGDPLAELVAGQVDAAIVRTAPSLPHPAGWLEPAEAVDALVARELPEELAGPLTGSDRAWSSIERRAVDRAIDIPLAIEVASAIAGPGVDRGSILLQPVLGPDLTALRAR